MNFKNSLSVVFVSAIILTGLFYRQYIGLNLVLFEVAFIAWLIISKQLRFSSQNEIISTLGLFLTGVFTVITHSTYVYFIHFFALFVFIGVLNYSTVRSLATAYGLSIIAMFMAPVEFIKRFFSSEIKGFKMGQVLWKSRIFLIPLFIIAIFVLIYSFSNAVFGDIVADVGEKLQKMITFVFQDIDFLLIFTFLFSLLISAFLLIRIRNHGIEKAEGGANENLVRRKERLKRIFSLTALKSEYKAGIFLLIALNTLLLIVNAIDIYWVWFNFEWDGETLKEFVHAGTYLLILSILISIAVVLYFFRGNLNFYKQNSFLKKLTYAWLIQNGILALSVAIRNYWYIQHFNLAYKRIGVIVFLLVTVYGLYTVVRKIQHRKSGFFLIKSNAMAIYIAFVLTSFVNWDGLIAKYNFAHADSAYLHLEYLADFSDKTLPILDRSLDDLNAMKQQQNEKFGYDPNDVRPGRYVKKIERRKQSFKETWESKNFLSWNLPEYRAYWSLFE